MTAALQLTRSAAGQEDRQRIVIVLVAVAQGAAIENQRMIEQRAVAVGRRLQLFEEVGQDIHVVAVENARSDPCSLRLFEWCDALWNPSRTPLFGYTVPLVSREYSNVEMRVISAWKASTCRSNISLRCSSKSSGMPTGASGSSRRPTCVCFAAFWMRRSISRTSSRYSLRRVRSAAGEFFLQTGDLVHHRIEKADRSVAPRARRCASVLPSPNRRSNTTCGLFSIGSGTVGDFQEIVLR